jgi:hypothetical protein
LHLRDAGGRIGVNRAEGATVVRFSTALKKLSDSSPESHRL